MITYFKILDKVLAGILEVDCKLKKYKYMLRIPFLIL
jgi:hypothetical protein